MMLDEKLRSRMAALAAADEPALDEGAVERVIHRITEAGPEIVRRARRRRWMERSALAVGFAAAAGAILAVGLRSERGELASVGPAQACLGRPAPTAASFVDADGRARLDLGATALAVASSGATASVERVEACFTGIRLSSGRVAVHARDLGGGALVVHAGDTDVAVHGTIFAVERRDDSIVVEVAEGLVGVTRGSEHQEVHPGGRLVLSSVGAASSALEPADVLRLRAEVGVAEAPADPPALTIDSLEAVDEPSALAHADAPRAAGAGSPEALLRAADEARRAGDVAGARRLYRQVATGAGVSAEAALVALARMELGQGNAVGALSATGERQKRFGQGSLGPEALWIEVRAHRSQGNLVAARRAAATLADRWPSSAQAEAARRFLESK